MPFCSLVMQIEPPPIPTFTEALGIDHVSGSDLDGIAVVIPYPLDRALLPLGEALGGVDAEDVGSSLDKGGDALGVVPRVYSGADDELLMRVEELERVLLMAVVVLAENEVHEPALVVDNREVVYLIIPYYIVGFLEGGLLRGDDEAGERGHKGLDLFLARHTGYAVIAACDNAEKLSVRSSVLGDGNGVVSGAGRYGKDVFQRVGGLYV